MLQMFVLALSLYNTWNRGVFLLCKITNLLIYSKDKKYVAAITTIELVLILVILIALLLIFKEQLISLITTIFEKVTSESSGI